MRGAVVLAVSLVKVCLGQVSGGSGAVGATHLLLHLGKGIEGILEVVDYELPALVVGIGGVLEVVVLLGAEVLVDREGDVLIETFEKEMAVAAQETHLGNSTVAQRIARGVHRAEHLKRRVGTRDGVVEAFPHIGDVPVGGHDALRHLEGVEHVAVLRTVAALVGVVGANVEIPHRERRVDVLGRNPYGISRNHQIVDILRVEHLLLVESALGLLLVEEVVAAGRGQGKSGQGGVYSFFHEWSDFRRLR